MKDGSKSSLASNTHDDVNDNAICQAASVYEDLDYENVVANVDKEMEVINNDISLYLKSASDYDYLLTPDMAEINGDFALMGYPGYLSFFSFIFTCLYFVFHCKCYSKISCLDV